MLIRNVLLGVLIATTKLAYSQEKFFSHTKDEKPVKVLMKGKSPVLVTEHSVYLLEKNVLSLKFNTSENILTALLDTALWLGTDKGLLCVSLKSFKINELNTKNSLKGEVVALTQDSAKSLWVSVKWGGTYKQSQEGFVKMMEVMPVLSMSANNEQFVWVGTTVGLYKLSIKNNQNWLRYAEEGYSGYELPDNIIEQLYSFDKSGTWVVMADHIGFIPNNHFEGHVPAFNFIGTPDNSVFDIVKYINQSFVFASSTGLIVLPTEPEDPHSHEGYVEVHSSPKSLPLGYALDEKQLGLDASFVSSKVEAMLVDTKNNIWVANKNGLQKVSAKKLKLQVELPKEKKNEHHHAH